MNNKTLYSLFALIILVVFLLQITIRSSVAAEKSVSVEEKKRSFREITLDLSKDFADKKFLQLKDRLRYREPLRLEYCNTDIGTDISIDELIKVFDRDSKNTVIRVNQKSGSGMIETEGWNSEHPFLYFEFSYLQSEKQWYWIGVCASANRSLDFAMFLGGKDKIYSTVPKLPRVGPRVFEDEIALRSRIEEIIHFKAFNALKPYATKKVLAFGQCSREMMEKDGIVGKAAPVQDVINFLTSNTPKTGEIVSSGLQHKTYYETTGWNGEYPYIAFWFSENNKKWQLSGVSYCKTRHFDLFPPLSPLK